MKTAKKTRIYLQRSVPIQPKTSNTLLKFCRSAVVSPTTVLKAGGFDARRHPARLAGAAAALSAFDGEPAAARLHALAGGMKDASTEEPRIDGTDLAFACPGMSPR